MRAFEEPVSFSDSGKGDNCELPAEQVRLSGEPDVSGSAHYAVVAVMWLDGFFAQ